MIVRRKNGKRRRGAAVVETAFILSIFLLFLIGIMEYARFLFFMHLATNAATQGARYAVVHTGDGTTAAQVQAQVTNIMGNQQSYLSSYAVNVFAAQTGVSPPVAIAGANWNEGQFGTGICVQVSGTYSFIAGTLLGINSTQINVSSVMTSEAN